ncbi:hypothetical protein F5Y01DRAFT_313290 [Xylaria sp. FL0043]|nr:hypothetical protein F5Y01DRAFT_313290 [Xylaria sp. FL0043]
MLQPVMSPPMSMQAESLQPAHRRSSIEIPKSKSSTKSKDNKSSSSASPSPFEPKHSGTRRHSIKNISTTLKDDISTAVKDVFRATITGFATTSPDNKTTTTAGPHASTRHPVDPRGNGTQYGRPHRNTNSANDEGAARLLAKEAVAEEHAAFIAQRVESLRAEAIFSSPVDIGRLRELAEYEGVSLNPRSIRFQGKEYSLYIGLVACLSGGRRDADNDEDDENACVFLGRDRSLYVFERNDRMGNVRKIELLQEEEEAFSEYREIARAYYQLCDPEM